MKADAIPAAGKQGRGLLLGAFAPWALLGLLLTKIFGATRLRRFQR